MGGWLLYKQIALLQEVVPDVPDVVGILKHFHYMAASCGFSISLFPLPVVSLLVVFLCISLESSDNLCGTVLTYCSDLRGRR